MCVRVVFRLALDDDQILARLPESNHRKSVSAVVDGLAMV